MSPVIISSAIFISGVIIFLGYLYRRHRILQEEYIRQEEIKRQNLNDLRNIGAMTGDIQRRYDAAVYVNVNSKIEYIISLIVKMPELESQATYISLLRKMTYETQERLKERYDDVAYIISPLNNLLRKIEADNI